LAPLVTPILPRKRNALSEKRSFYKSLIENPVPHALTNYGTATSVEKMTGIFTIPIWQPQL